MAEKALVETQVDDSVALVQKLDADGYPPAFAAWYYYDDADEWRLIIAGTELDALLGKHDAIAYRKIVDAMSAISLASLAVSDIKLIKTDGPLPKALKFLIGTGPTGIVRAHCTDTTLNGIFIKEMVILRSA